MRASPRTQLLKAVIVNSRRDHAEMDAAALRDVPFEVAGVFASGTHALSAVSRRACDLILVGDSLEDMDMKSFIRLVRHSANLKDIPVVAVTGADDRKAILDAVAAGCSGYVLRPYSQATLEKHVAKALNLMRRNASEARQMEDARMFLEMGDYEEAVEAFEEIVSKHSEARRFYDLGCRYLARDKYDKAIAAFQRAVRLNDLFAEAYEGLSEAYRRMGDLEKHQRYLKMAARVYAEFDQLDKVKELFVDILKVDPGAVNPFNNLGIRLRKQGSYDAAIHAYQQALELTPFDENVHYNLARAYWYEGEDAKAVQELYVALGMNEDFPEARKLFARIRGVEYGTSDAAARVARRMEKADKDVE